jgi:hypothetical protein
MVISVRQIANKCLGLQGNFSIVKDLLGYGSSPVPGFTSLSQELILLRDKEHITIHIKIVSSTTWTYTSTVPIDQMIFSMRLIFRTANVAVIIKSTENLTLPDIDIDVGSCNGTATNDLNTLFNNKNFVGSNEIVAYFVRGIVNTGDPLNGCASYPANKPGVTVDSSPSRYTLAHEIGHVLIGPKHIEEETSGSCPAQTDQTKCTWNNIMTCCGTINIDNNIPANTIPTFNNNQAQRIINSNLTFPCPP